MSPSATLPAIRGALAAQKKRKAKRLALIRRRLDVCKRLCNWCMLSLICIPASSKCALTANL
jgi:hypothetical protein